MKRLIYNLLASIIILTCPKNSIAQITLEHTFNGNANFCNAYILNGDVNYYSIINSTDNQIKLFNMDYSLYKTITILPPSGYKISGVSFFTKHLFNNDDKIEFLVMFYSSTSNSNLNTTNKLYNEDENLIKDFGYYYLSTTNIIKINDQYRLLLLCYTNNTLPFTYKTEIYSLPGTMSSSIAETENINKHFSLPFPNPSNSFINLPYQLNQGQQSVMRIFNTQGQLIEIKQLDYEFDKIILNVSNYSKGIYFYEVNGISNTFIVQ